MSHAGVQSEGEAARQVALYHRLFGDGLFVHSPSEPYFQERLLQAVWNEQLFKSELRTADGLPLRVLHRGVWNVAAGADFQDAVLEIGGQLHRGPVEIHLHPEDWDRHRHRGADYQEVALHAVWENRRGHPQYPPGVPLFIMADALARPLPELVEALDLSVYPYARQVSPEQCALQLAKLTDERLGDLLHTYGLARLLRKARELDGEIRRLGLEEAVYRRFLDAMGYKSNRAACAELAQLLPLRDLAGGDLISTQASLLGAAGLLPDPTLSPVLPRHRVWLGQLWQAWWPRRREYRPITWVRLRQRPANAPERRLLATAAVWHRQEFRLGANLLRCLREPGEPRLALRRAAECFSVPNAEWDGLRDFGHDLTPPLALLGSSRTRDLLVNLALPLLFAQAFQEGRPEACQRGKELLAHLPRLEDNRRLREAAHQLLVPPSRAHTLLRHACAQQGLLLLQETLTIK